MELHSVLSKIEDGVSKKSPAQSIVTLIVKSLGEFEAVSELVNEYIAKLK
jgi:hypothetical protein